MDITMTATLRPHILERTLSSFNYHLFDQFKGELRLVVNLDLIGEEDKEWACQQVLNVIDLYFSDTKIKVSHEPSFPAAFKWVWENTESEFVFHLEDDWELLRRVDLLDMIHLMHEHPSLAILRLPFTNAGTQEAKQWNKWFPWNGEFFECPKDMRGGLGFSGHPSLIRKDFIDLVTPMLKTDRCPEKQIKWRTSRRMQQILECYRFGVFQQPNEPKAVRDIGQPWRAAHKITKKGGVFGFTTWEKN